METKTKNDQFNKPDGPFPGNRPPFGPNRPAGPGGPGSRPPIMMPVPGLDFPVTNAVAQFADLAYADVSPSQKLDLYLPQGSGPFPLVLLVHGGGFMFGDKGDPISKAGTDQLLDRGYAVANVNYRLSGEAKAPAQVWDMKTAVRWLHHASKYNLDPKKFGAWGGSAGGNLVALLGTSFGIAALEGAELGYPNESSQVQAVIDWFGPLDFLKMDEQSAVIPEAQAHNAPDSPESILIGAPVQTRPDLAKLVNPITYVSPTAAPFFIQHGTADKNVPPKQSQMLYDALKPVIGEDHVTLVLLDGAGHGGGPQFWNQPNVAALLAFLDNYLK